MKITRQVSVEVIYNDELPYRVSIGGAHGAGDNPKSAVIAALSVGKLIPPRVRLSEGAILDFLEENYEDTRSRNILINIIKRNEII